MEHVVYCDSKEAVLEKIISGSKSMIARAGEARKIPHSRVFKGDKLYFLNKNDCTIFYEAEVSEVYNYTKIPLTEIKRILAKYKLELNLSENQMQKYCKKCLCLIEFNNFRKCNPIIIKEQSPLKDWIIVDNVNQLSDTY